MKYNLVCRELSSYGVGEFEVVFPFGDFSPFEASIPIDPAFLGEFLNRSMELLGAKLTPIYEL